MQIYIICLQYLKKEIQIYSIFHNICIKLTSTIVDPYRYVSEDIYIYDGVGFIHYPLK